MRHIASALIVLLWGIIPLNLFAQDYWSKRFDLDRGNDYGTQVIATDSGLIIMVTALCDINNRNCEGFIVLDNNGNLIWEAIVYDTIDANYFDAVALMGDSILVNMTYLGIQDKDYAVLSYDMHGNSGSIYNYYQASMGSFHVARAITALNDRVFVNFEYQDMLTGIRMENLRAYQTGWNMLWEVVLPNTDPWITWCDTEATEDGGVVVIYHSWGSPGGAGIATIEKYDVDGEMEWQTILPHAYDRNGRWVRIDTHIDGGYVGFWDIDTFGLNINEHPGIIFKLDSMGEIEWERVDYDEQIRIWNIFSTQNGDIVGCGVEEDWPWVHDSIEYRAGYIVRFNSLGERIWDRKIIEERGGADYYHFYAGSETANGDLVFTGIIGDSIYGTPDDPTPDNVWVVKVDSMGCFEPGCDEWQYLISATQDVTREEETEFILFPNPASELIMLGAQIGAHIPRGDYTALLYNNQAQLIAHSDFDPNRITEFDISDFQPGLYTMSILLDSRIVQVLKFLVH